MVYASIYMKFKLGRIVLQFQREDKDHGLGDDGKWTDLERKEMFYYLWRMKMFYTL